MTANETILLVEDNPDDLFLMKRALRSACIVNPLVVVETGQEAIDYLGGVGKFVDRESYPIPAAVFIDLNLPLVFGHEVLAWIRRREDFESLVVIVLTSSNQTSDLNRCYSLGANSYLIKPPTAEQLEARAKAFKWQWLKYER
ncbi:MAG TPA: response regulator [Candidatus Polarisedimenticolaceae bacterium]|nr:response regulator [Candidatus Polarisedimenticolaceae bacterium]